jgi:hypothetical protein
MIAKTALPCSPADEIQLPNCLDGSQTVETLTQGGGLIDCRVLN